MAAAAVALLLLLLLLLLRWGALGWRREREEEEKCLAPTKSRRVMDSCRPDFLGGLGVGLGLVCKGEGGVFINVRIVYAYIF